MRFLVDGIDIPNELIDAQEQGRVVFHCGAGVSFGAGLPGFGELVDGVYQRLHERIEDRPAGTAFRNSGKGVQTETIAHKRAGRDAPILS